MKEPNEESSDLKIERQKYQLHKKGYEDITKAISSLKEEEKPEVQKVQIIGLENLQGKEGPQGKKGDAGPEGPMGSVEIKADGEVVKKADTIVINGFAGPKGDKGDKGDSIKGDKGDKGDNGKDGADGKDGSPDTPDAIVSKLQSVKKEWLDINAIKGDFNSRVRKVVGISSLKHLTDVDYSGLTQDANGNYILGSGSGGGITVQDIDGNPTVSDVTTIKFTNGAVTDNGDGTVNVTTGSGGGGDVSSSVGVSVDSEVAIFDGTGGKTIKRATGTGVAHLSSGVLSASNVVTADITDANVTLAKMADVATGTVFYRKTAGTGVPEVQTLATLKTDLGLSGTNTGDQTSIVGITGTKAQFDTAVSDGNILYVGDITQYTDEMAQDAVGNAVGAGLSYNDGTGAISSTITQYTDEMAQDAIGGMVVDSTFIDLAYVDGTPSLTASLSATGTPSSSTYLRGDNTWATVTGSGDVSKVGTPVNNQIGVWTGDGTIEGDASLTFDTATDLLSTVNVTLTGELTLPNTGLHLLDTNASHDLIIAPGSNLTADRTLTLTTGDTNMILDLTAVTDEYVLAYDAGTNTWRGVVASGGGGATAINDIGDATGAGAVAVTSNTQTWTWNGLTTGDGLFLSSNSLTTGMLLNLGHDTSVLASGGALLDIISTGVNTGTTKGVLLNLEGDSSTTATLSRISANGLTSGSALSITSTSGVGITGMKGINVALSGANNGSSQATYGGYFSNVRTGTTSVSTALYATTSGASLITDIPLEVVGHQGGGIKFGNRSSTEAALWLNSVTPSSTNYSMSLTSGGIQAQGAFGIRSGASSVGGWNSIGIWVDGGNNAATGGQRFIARYDPTASANYGEISLGAQGNWNAGGTTPFAGSSSGTGIAINYASSYAGDFVNFQTAGTSKFKIGANGAISVATIADASAPNSSLYFSSTASKLVWKDAGGTVNNLY